MEVIDYHNYLMETSEPEKKSRLNEMYYNCSDCSSSIEIISINEKENIIEFECLNNNHRIKMSIKDYIDKMKKFNNKNINSDICLEHKNKYECICLECNKHLCKSCLKTRIHINHQKINIIEIQPNIEDLEMVENIINKNKGNIEVLERDNIKKLYEIIYYTYCNFRDNYYNAININKVLIDFYKNELNEDYKNSIKIVKEKEKINEIIAYYDNLLNEMEIENEKIINEMNNKYNILKTQYDEAINKNQMIYKRVTYKNGNIYEGEFRNDKRQEQENVNFNNINKNKNDCGNDIREGKGILYRNDGGRYEGEYKNDKAEGKGILYFSNGDRYEGEFKNDYKGGRGIFYFKNGDRYEGEFKNDKAEGKGIYYYYKEDARYEGDWNDNKKEGKGILYLSNGDRIIGDYLNDKCIGKHVLFLKNGEIHYKIFS